MIDDLWLIKLKIDVKSRNPDMLLEEYIKTTKQELLSYTKVFKKGQILYRGRLGYKSYYKEDSEKMLKFKYPYYGKDIKNPPCHLSEAARFNRDGFSYLYLSSDEKTCIAELRLKIGSICSIAEFKQKKDLRLLNLDKNKTLKDFLITPVCDDNIYHYKFTRFISDLIKAIGIDGIAYDSVQSNGKCFVIFDDQNFELVTYSEKMFLAKRVEYDFEEVLPEFIDNPEFESFYNDETDYIFNNPNYKKA
ncbi:MAG: RES family NAD+ phosphorylase [Acholeplasmatales bacterium]|nr:RES family NAD+ phosphorylase [Acholeplasmatales bacterium]